MGTITTKCQGCARLTNSKDPLCITCEGQNNYISRPNSLVVDTDIKKEMTMLAKQALNAVYGRRKDMNLFELANNGKAVLRTSDGVEVQVRIEEIEQRHESDSTEMAIGCVALSEPRIKYGDCYRSAYVKHVTAARIKNVIFNDPATIVMWSDGTKTVVKCGENDIFDPEKGLAMAISKKLLGDNKGRYFEEFKKWLPKVEEEKEVSTPGKTFKEAVGNALANLNALEKALGKEAKK